MPSTTYLQLQSDDEEEGSEEKDLRMNHRGMDPVRELSARDKLSANAQAVGQTRPESFFFPFFFLSLYCEELSFRSHCVYQIAVFCDVPNRKIQVDNIPHYLFTSRLLNV